MTATERLIRVSTFEHARASFPHPHECTWDELVNVFSRFDFSYPSKESLPAFSPCEFRPGAKTRTRSNALRVHFGVLDCDEISDDQVLQLAEALEGLDAFIYTTWSHAELHARTGLWRLRAVIRFSRPVGVSEWRTFWPKLVARFGGFVDSQCKDPNRIYYGPCAPAGTEPYARFVRFNGAPLDVDNLAAPFELPAFGQTKVTRERLEALANRWRKSKDEYRAHMGETLRLVCRGEPYADEGNRDNVTFQLCQDIAKAIPDADPESVARHFAQSLQLMGKGAPTYEEVRAKLERALENVLSEVEAERFAEETERRLRIRQAFAHIDPERTHPYTAEEIEAFAREAKCTVEEFSKRWIIQRGKQFYFFCAGEYSQAYGETDALNAALRDLAPASSAGVELFTTDAQGNTVRKSLAMLVADYGTVANDYVLDLRAQRARYDEARRLFIEAPAPLRDLAPEYDHDVAIYLEALAGPQYHDLQTWLALVTNLDEPCAALMLTGPKSTGKTLLALGLSRLWTTRGPTDIVSAMGDFNDAIAHCPLILADEQLPKDWRGHGRTAELRQFISATSRPYRKKYAHESAILGCIRLIITANNEDVLAIHENLSVNDIEAIGDRFYHIRVQPEAAEWLSRFCDTRSFIEGDRIAKHALWLRDNHKFERKGRFLIKSPDRELYRALTTKAGIRSDVCQWLVSYLKNPRKLDARGDYLVRVKDGRLLVNSRGMLDAWDDYVSNAGVPPTGRLSQAIAGLSTGRVHMARPGKTSVQYRVIDTDHLLAWANETEFATRNEILEALAVDTEARAASAPLGANVTQSAQSPFRRI